MKDLGVGKNSLESCIQQETSEMILHLSELLTTDSVTLRIDDFFDLPCLNVIWSLVNTRRFSYDDQHMKKMIELIDKFTMNNYVGPLGWISFYHNDGNVHILFTPSFRFQENLNELTWCLK